MFGNDGINAYYKQLFTLMIADNSYFTITELESLIPFELEIYAALLTEKIKKDANRKRNS